MEVANSTLSFLSEMLMPKYVHTFGILIIISAILFLINYHINRRGKLEKLPPGPTGIPIFGYLPFIGKLPHLSFNELGKKYGNLFGFYLGSKYVVVCNDWEAKKEVFGKMAVSNRPPGLLDVIPGELGFAGKNGIEWSEQRKYSVKAIKYIGLGKPMWEEMLQKEASEAIQSIAQKKGKPIAIDDVCSSSFTSSVMTLILGHRLPFNDPISKFLTESMHRIMLALNPMDLSVFLPNLAAFLAKLGLYGSEEAMNAIMEFHEYVQNIVRGKLRSKEDSTEESFIKIYNEAVENNKKLNLNNSFTEKSLYANCEAMLLGGGDTTRDSTIWLLVAMAQFPDIQSKVHEELDNVIGKHGCIKWSERNRIPYTYACVLENTRWRTIAPINVFRMTVEDIEVFGYRIPKGTYITANNWAIHNDPRYWPNPERFEPERFLVNGGKQIALKLESYTPFSYGKRGCPGEHIAMVSMLQYFTQFMQNFVVLPAEGKVVKHTKVHGLIDKPKGVCFRFVPRQ